MKKLFVLSLLAFSFIFILPIGSVVAQTTNTATLQKMSPVERDQAIESLLREVAALKQQLAELQARSKQQSEEKIRTDASWCHTFNTNLSIGMTGSEVTDLQTGLTKAGFTVEATGNFGEATAAAVSAFQISHRDEILTPNGLTAPTGYFGSSTRTKMNQLYGCGNAVTIPQTDIPFINISWPVNTPTLIPGQTYRIQWTSNNVSTLNIFLGSYSNQLLQQDIAINVPASRGSYTWTVPSYTSAANDYRIHLQQVLSSTHMGVWDQEPVSISSVSETQQPDSSPVTTPTITITSPTASSVWNTTSAAWWYPAWTSQNLAASELIKIELLTPANQPVAGFAPVTTANDGSAGVNLANVSPGTYYFRFTTTANGVTRYFASPLFVIASATITPPPPPATPSPTASYITASAGTGGTISPSGTITINRGASQTFIITPSAGYRLSNVYVDGAIVGGISSTGYTFANVQSNHTINASFFLNDTTPPSSPPPPPPIATPTITVTSPTANVVWAADQGHTVTWSTTGLGGGTTLTMELLTPANGAVPGFNAFATANDGSESMSLASVSPGYYYFRLKATVNGQTIYGGSGIFQLVASLTTIPPPAPSTTAVITITAPGAISQWSGNQTVTWTSTGVPAGNSITIELLTPSNGLVSGGWSVATTNTGSKLISLSSVVPGYYYFRLKTTVNGQIVYGGSPVFKIN